MLTQVQGQANAVAMLQRVAVGTYTSPLLLLGPDGVGRRLSVECLVRQMFCTGSHTVTCDCLHCVQLQHKVHADYLFVQPEEGKDIGIDVARQILALAASYPVLAPVRVILIDGVDRLTTAAANALLKTIEEPPPFIRFFFTANALGGVLPTIKSRCGIVQYNALPEAFVLSLLERTGVSPEKAHALAQLAEGSAGQALSFWATGKLKLRDKVITLLESSVGGDLSRIFSGVDDIGDSILLGTYFLLAVLRDLLLLKHTTEGITNVDVLSTLQALQVKVPHTKVLQLYVGIRALHARERVSSINFPFHVKTLLATTFV